MRFLQKLSVLFAKRFQPLFYKLKRVFVIELKFGFLNRRNVHIVHMHSFKSEVFLFVANVPMKRRQRGIDGFEQVFVHNRLHVFCGQSPVQTRLVFTRLGQEHVFVYVAGINGSYRID